MIRFDRTAGLCRITIDRPEKAGALTRVMLLELVAQIEAAADAKAVIFTGTGPVFSAGADLDEARAGLATDPVWERLSAAVAHLPGLTIAALNGTAAGGALGLVLACDLRISVAKANIFYPVMKLGFLPQPSDPARLAALVGSARAKMILMAGQKIPAERALAWGLIDQIAAPDELIPVAEMLCNDVLAADLDHVRQIKQLIPAG